jgi:hypothetical protein
VCDKTHELKIATADTRAHRTACLPPTPLREDARWGCRSRPKRAIPSRCHSEVRRRRLICLGAAAESFCSATGWLVTKCEWELRVELWRLHLFCVDFVDSFARGELILIRRTIAPMIR